MRITTSALRRSLLTAGLTGALALSGAGTSGASVTAAPSASTTSAAAPTARTAPAAKSDDGKLLLMLDASGSMKEKDPSGGTKMQAAKKALTGVVKDLPADTNVGLRVYGATEPGGKPTKAACADTQLAVPIGPLDKTAMRTAIDGFRAKGETPIAHSLEKGLEDLGDSGKRNIILVSDGKESCVPDPCPTIKKLAEDGVDLRIDTVGFGVEETARKQLQCIADAGGGTYYDAEDADELSTSLNKLSTRAVRDFSFTGQPVKGVDVGDEEQPPKDLPVITPGLWTDELTSSETTWRAYRIERTQKRSTLHVSFATRPSTFDAEAGDHATEQFDLEIQAPDDTVCVSTSSYGGENDQGLSPINTITARLHGQSLEGDLDPACRKRGKFTVYVQRKGDTKTTPTEIQVIEEPAVTNLDELRKPAEDYPKEKELKAGKAKPVTGGLSFADAPEISSGTWVDTLVPGETLLYRVKVEPGQTPRFTINGPTRGFRYPGDGVGYDVLWVDGRAFGPDRQEVTDNFEISGSFREGSPSPKSVAGPPVRWSNRFSDAPLQDELRASSMGGWYYYAVGIGTGDLGKQLAGQPIKVAFTVDVEGKPSGGPEYAADGDWQAAAIGEKADPSDRDETSHEASSATHEDEGVSALPWVGGGLLAALVIGGGAWFGIRRSRGDG